MVDTELAPPLSKRRLRLWLRMLGITRTVENHLREYLRVQHDTTLPRFDVMAALYREGEPINMSQLSRMLLVSNGNATAIVDRLAKAGFVRRVEQEGDRRSVFVTLTESGRAEFERCAGGHEQEVDRLLESLTDEDLDALRTIFRKLRGRLGE